MLAILIVMGRLLELVIVIALALMTGAVLVVVPVIELVLVIISGTGFALEDAMSKGKSTTGSTSNDGRTSEMTIHRNMHGEVDRNESRKQQE